MTAMTQSSPKERHAMGNLARLHVSGRFSIEAMLDRWEGIYGKLLRASLRSPQRTADPVSV
jgi:hypothetical protein